MNDKPCVIEVNDNEFYYPCDYRDNIILVSNRLVNTGSQQIVLYADYPNYNDSYSGYPRIYMPTNNMAYYRQSYNASSTTLNVNSANFISSRYSNDLLLNIVLIFIVVLSVFKR